MAETLFTFPTPFTPPTTEEDRLSALRLIRSRRVGPATYHRLIGEYGNAAAALDSLPAIAESAGVRDYRPCPRADAEAEMAAANRAGAWLLCHGAPGYPAALAALSDAPPVLWCIGDAARLEQQAVALVGARNASSLGQRMARALAGGLGIQGFCVVSGLARGIDACAHAAALETGTIAVLAGGVDVIYPPENTALAALIAEAGLLMSEAPMGLQPQARHFPGRNRIISGIALGVVVVEAALRSGSLITARDALDQGREVMAVPGHPFDARASGCNALLRDGATLVRGAEDVCAALAARGSAENPAAGVPPQNGPHPRAKATADAPGERAIAPAARTPISESRNVAASEADISAPQSAATVGTARSSPNAAGADGRTGGSAQSPRAPRTGPPAGQSTAGAAAGQTRHVAKEPDCAGGYRSAAAGTDAAHPTMDHGAARPLADPSCNGPRRDVPPKAKASGPPPARSQHAPAPARPHQDSATLRDAILARLSPSPLAEDQLIRDLAQSAAQVAPALLLLELEGQVLRQPGGLLSLHLPG